MSSKKEDSSKNGDASMRNPIEFREWFKILFRVWRPHFTLNQFQIILFIFDRTAGWGKQWEVITHRHFLEGIVSGDGKSYGCGLTITKPTLILNLRTLTESTAIEIRKVGSRTAFSINYEWQPTQENMKKLATPKRLLHSLQTEKGKVALPPTGKVALPPKGKVALPLRKEKENCYAKGKEDALHPRGAETENELELSSLIESTKSHSRSRRKARIASWSTSSALTAWLDFCGEHQSDLSHLATTKTDGIILHKYGKRWISQSRDADAWLEYLEWVIKRWATIRNEQFGWMNASSPGVPSIRFFVRFSDRFEQAYSNRSMFEHIAGMTTREREIDRLVKKGMDKDVAEKDVDAKLGLTRERQAIEKASNNLKKQRLAQANDQRVKDEAEQRNADWRTRRSIVPAGEAVDGSFDEWK